jgi:filamentous hemagglutinin
LPVVGNVRQFLFNYETHNFEGALGSFGLLALELTPIGSVSRGVNLTTLGLETAPRGIRVSQAGLALVERHLAQFGKDGANEMMMETIKAAHQSGLRIFGPYKDFYMHELYESTLMRRGVEYEASHLQALERYAVTQMQLYHPKVIRYFHQTQGMFSQAYLNYWGIK